MEKVKALTLYQPYATAIALGLKRFETRGWATKHRCMIAIHAATAMPTWAKEFAATEVALGRIPSRLPLGAVVCIADLVEVVPSAVAFLDTDAIERLYGDFSAGRFAWRLDNIQVLVEPCFVKGRQGIWEWPAPKDVLLRENPVRRVEKR